MNILAIDTTSKNLMVAVKIGHKVFYEKITNNAKHLQTLMPVIDRVFDAAQISLENIDHIACVVGPGSFTGIRIGISTIKSFLTLKSFKTLPVNYLEMLSYINLVRNKDKFVTAAIFSTLEKLYVADYSQSKGLGEISVKTLEEIKEEASLSGKKVITNEDINGFIKIEYTPEEFLNFVEELSVKNKFGNLLPCYVSLSQAERELQKREAKDGNS